MVLNWFIEGDARLTPSSHTYASGISPFLRREKEGPVLTALVHLGV